VGEAVATVAVRPALRTAVLTVAALGCFAANSLLARAALRPGLVDAATFTAVRVASGALALAGLALARRRGAPRAGSWGSGFAIFAYAAAFSLAYVRIAAGPGALILFVAVQGSMIGWSVVRGVGPRGAQWAGIAIAGAGLVLLTVPGASAPDPIGAALMVVAGSAWGVYSVRGRSATDPVATTAGNFLRALPFAAAFALAAPGLRHASASGLALAVMSGAVTSGGGYVLWYAALPALGAARAASVQLAVPVLAAAAAVAILGEPLTLRLVVAGTAILAGIGLSIRPRR
jgi:drug/metabolite transporter (DMT)-like permease